MLRSDLSDFSDAYINVEGTITITATDPDNTKKETKVLRLKTIRHLPTAFQNSMAYKLKMQKTQIL